MSMRIDNGTARYQTGSDTLKNTDKAAAERFSVTRRSSRKKKKKKRLNYNYKELSARVLRAQTSQSARQAAAGARVKAAMLRRKLKSGEYNEKEVKLAIAHAEGMEQAAEKKVRHLLHEERAERLAENEKESAIEELPEASLEEQESRTDTMEEHKHRSEELEKVMEEDMRYLKKLFRIFEQERQSPALYNSESTGITPVMESGGTVNLSV